MVSRLRCLGHFRRRRQIPRLSGAEEHPVSGRRATGERTKRKQARKAAAILILRPARLRQESEIHSSDLGHHVPRCHTSVGAAVEIEIVVWRAVGKWEKTFLPKSEKALSDLSPNLQPFLSISSSATHDQVLRRPYAREETEQSAVSTRIDERSQSLKRHPQRASAGFQWEVHSTAGLPPSQDTAAYALQLHGVPNLVRNLLPTTIPGRRPRCPNDRGLSQEQLGFSGLSLFRASD